MLVRVSELPVAAILKCVSPNVPVSCRLMVVVREWEVKRPIGPHSVRWSLCGRVECAAAVVERCRFTV